MIAYTNSLVKTYPRGRVSTLDIKLFFRYYPDIMTRFSKLPFLKSACMSASFTHPKLLRDLRKRLKKTDVETRPLLYFSMLLTALIIVLLLIMSTVIKYFELVENFLFVIASAKRCVAIPLLSTSFEIASSFYSQ